MIALVLGLVTAAKLFAQPQSKAAAPAPDLTRISHIVFIFQENRTFDNYFGSFPGADGATSGPISTGQVIPFVPPPDFMTADISHSFQAAQIAIDGATMPKFDLIQGGSFATGYHP